MVKSTVNPGLSIEVNRLAARQTARTSCLVVAGSDDIVLAFVDVAGFDRTIWERCEGLRTRKIPFPVLSPKRSMALQQASLTHGARGVMVKPLVVKELLGVIRSLLEEDE